MNFNDWKEAVNNSLKGAGKTFGVDDIDIGSLTSAFAQGMSPVIFARQAQPVPKPIQPTVAIPSPKPRFGDVVPPPSRWIVRVTALILGINGWISWVVSALILLLFILVMVGAIGVAATSKEMSPGEKTQGLVGFMILGTPIALVYSFVFAFSGAISHYLAQRLLIAWHSWK